MNNFKFSVAMSTYGSDNPDWLETAVESVLRSTIVPDEIVLVVDGPVENELNSVIEKYEKNPIFKVVRLEKNVGLGTALSVAVENCSNELVARMDSDDINMPNRFEKQLSIFKNDPELSIVGSNITEFIGDSENIVSKRTVPQNNDEIREYIKYRCPFNHMTVMFKKSDVEKVGGYIHWHYNEDYYLWIRMHLGNMKSYNLQDSLVNVRIGQEMYNRRGGIEYFKSEANLQKFMLDNKIISFSTYLVNVLKRLIVQVLLPSRVRGWVFKKFARKGI